ncbi:MAG: LytR C-terminal domain-containing protein [Actinomycetota bacterium]
MPGRHAAPVDSNFYRDLAVMVGGIIIVGALVYLVLSIFFGNENTASNTTTTQPSFTTVSQAPETTVSTTATTRVTTTVVPTTTTTAIRPPAEVRVQVLNSTQIGGLARDVTDDLAAMGYQTIQQADHLPAIEQSRVWFAPGFEAEAAALAEAAVPDALVEPLPEPREDVDIVVVLGSSYQP